MALLDILSNVAPDVGAQDLDNNPEIRTYLVDKINQACEELYDRNDIPGCLRECYVRVTANKQIALPPFIGKVRAIRENSLKYPWTLRDLRPRYHYEEWKDIQYNWRLIGFTPICIDISNSAPFTYTIHAADSTLYIDTVGSTLNSKRVADRITMSSTSVTGAVSFNAIESIKVNKLADYDITISDADGNVVAVLYNDQLTTRYAWYDVSQYPETGDCSDGRFVMEVLYKLPLQVLKEDTDSFPVPGYDNAIALKTIQIILEKQEGKEQRAMLAHQKVESRMAAISKDTVQTHEHTFKIEPNKHLGMFRAYGLNRGRRMSKY
jgi:hypothetical protein